MASAKPRIAVPVPTTTDLPYNQQCWKQYAEALLDAGAEPVAVALDSDRRALTELLRECDGVCLPGSPADVDPARYGAARSEASAPVDGAREATDFFLLDWAAAEAKPVLGICFGMQSLNVWCGGTLVQDLNVLPVNHSAGASVAVAHSVLVSQSSGLATLLQAEEVSVSGSFLRLRVNSSHHQAVAVPGEGLAVVARCPEDGVIEAVELDRNRVADERERAAFPRWLLGVQWHPERSAAISASSRSLFRKLVVEAVAAAKLRRTVTA